MWSLAIESRKVRGKGCNFEISVNCFISAYASYSETTEMPIDAKPPEANDLYSHPTKRAWRRMEHIYMDIGPPTLPTRGYKDDSSGEETQCLEQHEYIHPAINLSVLWLQKASQSTLTAIDVEYALYMISECRCHLAIILVYNPPGADGCHHYFVLTIFALKAHMSFRHCSLNLNHQIGTNSCPLY